MSSIEAYILTASGRERIQRENNPLLSYEGALILDALIKGKRL
jgi:hypothetical protein